MLAKIVFDTIPRPLPSLVELTEVTLELPALPATAVISNGSIRRYEGQMGVWEIVDGRLI